MQKNVMGDPERWVELHGDYLFRYAVARVRNRQVAEDVVQETLLAAIKSRENFEGQSSERTWLIGILKHKILDYFRKANRERPLEKWEMVISDPEELFRPTGEWIGHWKEETAPIDWNVSPAGAIEQKQFWSVLEKCLSELPERMAQVFILREMDDLSTEEICKTMNISAANLWVMLHRARGQLRRSLEVRWFGKREKQADR
jgi:RNA polymerase sigma-70 factor (TIGR02943 family)